MIKTRLPSMTGKSDREVIAELTRTIDKLIHELSSPPQEPDTRLPVGTEIMRYSEIDNAGMDYGTWEMSGCVQSNSRVLRLYVRTK